MAFFFQIPHANTALLKEQNHEASIIDICLNFLHPPSSSPVKQTIPGQNSKKEEQSQIHGKQDSSFHCNF